MVDDDIPEAQRTREFWRTAAAGLVVAGCFLFWLWSIPAVPAEASPQRWFVQVWFDAGITDPANPDADPGRVEVVLTAAAIVTCNPTLTFLFTALC